MLDIRLLLIQLRELSLNSNYPAPSYGSPTHSSSVLSLHFDNFSSITEGREGGREEKCGRHICRGLVGGWFTDRQTELQ